MVIAYIRNENNEFVCPDCGIIKKNQNTMHYHMKKHEGSLPHQCKYCKSKFQQLRVLNLHISARHPETEIAQNAETFDCPACEYSSLTKANRRIHYFRLHMKDIIEKNVVKCEDGYECSNCNKSLKSQTAIYYHIGDCVKLPLGDPRKEEIDAIL